MTNWKWDKVIIDADFALKMNRLEQINAIEKYIPLLVKKLYIHEHVYENEILIPKRTKEQIDNLIRQGKAEVVDISSFGNDELSKIVYKDTINLLKKADPETIPNRKNWGEIVSLAFAKAKGIRYFFSDEGALQELIDLHINAGTDQDIKIIRLKDFILALKDLGIQRKEAYLLWTASHEKQYHDYAKRIFKNELWPL